MVSGRWLETTSAHTGLERIRARVESTGGDACRYHSRRFPNKDRARPSTESLNAQGPGQRAMANGDLDNVGMTLLRIDRGVDTGPVFGYFRVDATATEPHVITKAPHEWVELRPRRIELENVERLRHIEYCAVACSVAELETALATRLGELALAWNASSS